MRSNGRHLDVVFFKRALLCHSNPVEPRHQIPAVVDELEKHISAGAVLGRGHRDDARRLGLKGVSPVTNQKGAGMAKAAGQFSARQKPC